jgi:hypothetical protein
LGRMSLGTTGRDNDNATQRHTGRTTERKNERGKGRRGGRAGERENERTAARTKERNNERPIMKAKGRASGRAASRTTGRTKNGQATERMCVCARTRVQAWVEQEQHSGRGCTLGWSRSSTAGEGASSVQGAAAAQRARVRALWKLPGPSRPPTEWWTG